MHHAMKQWRLLELKGPRHPAKALLGIPVRQRDLPQRRLRSTGRQVLGMTTKDGPTCFPQGYFHFN